MDKQQLVDFEKRIAAIYKKGEIQAPIHLRDGNEDILIEYFKEVKPYDYCFCSWASHLHALLHGIPEATVEKDIIEGKSISLQYPDYNFYSSAIVAGILPIATGVAYALQFEPEDASVHCFIGDMTLRTGIAHESIMYALGFDLPISFVVENNNKSVCTPTSHVWGSSLESIFDFYKYKSKFKTRCRIYKYDFESSYNHSGIGEFVAF